MLHELKLTANQQTLQCDSIKLASGLVENIECEFTLDESWEGYDYLRALFTDNYGNVIEKTLTNNKCNVPNECLSHKGWCKVNLCAYDVISQQKVLQMTSYMTKIADITQEVAVDGDNTVAPTVQVWEQELANHTGNTTVHTNATERATWNAKVGEAPSDSKQYVRKNGAWAEMQEEAVTWNDIQGKPETFPPSAHNQAWSTITGKPESYPPSSHTHDDRYYTETETDTLLSGKANTSHMHTKANITDFAHTHTKSEITDFPSIPTKTSDLTNDSGFIDNTYHDATKANVADLADVATSGDYDDLSNKPTIPTVPTALSGFTDDLGSSPVHTHSQYLTEHQSLAAYRTSAAQDVIDATKVDKVTGKGLSTNDFTNDYKSRLDACVETITLTNGSETLDQIKARLIAINASGDHVLFDVSALNAQMYLCSIYIDNYANPTAYRVQDVVTGKASIGAYNGSKTLTSVLSEAVEDLVTITVTCTATDGITVTGNTITLRGGSSASAPIIATSTYVGQPVTFVVAKNTAYYVQSTNISGHFPVDPVNGLAANNVSVVFNFRDYGEVSSYEDVQTLCRAGIVDDALEIGQTFDLVKDGVTYPVAVMHIIENGQSGSIRLKNGLQQGVIFQTVDCVYSAQFDEREAFYACTDGLAAGDYYFKLGQHSWVSADVNKDFYFHVTNAIPAGGQLVFTQSYNATLENAVINIFDSATTYSASQTATMSSTVISGATNLGTLMNSKVGKFNSCQRALFGNNNWKESAIRQQLNSNASAGSVWTPQNIWDRAPSWRTSLKGFLNGIGTSLTDYIAEVFVDTYRNTVCDEGGLDTTSEKVFLVGNNEAYCPTEGADNGVAWDFYKNNSASPTPTGNADASRIKKLNNSATYWWWRSPYVGIAYYARFALPSGERGSLYAYYSYSVAPAFVIA